MRQKKTKKSQTNRLKRMKVMSLVVESTKNSLELNDKNDFQVTIGSGRSEFYNRMHGVLIQDRE
jgi:phosphotransferase system IIB component